MPRFKFKPDYKRQQEIDKQNDQLLRSMIKINGRTNNYIENEPKKIYNTNNRGKTIRKIEDDNMKLFENL